MGRDAFERLMGPAEDILKNEVEAYEKLNNKLIGQVGCASEAAEAPPEGQPDQKGAKLGRQGSRTLGRQGSQTLVKQGSVATAEKRAKAKSMAAPGASAPSKRKGADAPEYSEV
jgi:hypothetical protein